LWLNPFQNMPASPQDHLKMAAADGHDRDVFSGRPGLGPSAQNGELAVVPAGNYGKLMSGTSRCLYTPCAVTPPNLP
jgi:hypothetical protein